MIGFILIVLLLAGFSTGGFTEIITHINSEGIGTLAVRIMEPSLSRYVEGAPVVVIPGAFFTPVEGFPSGPQAMEIGAIEVSCVWPGQFDPQYQIGSDGIFDHGGPYCRQALRDVLLFALGELADTSGNHINDLCGVHALEGNVGIYAFSHPGIIATTVLAEYGSELGGVQYFVGRENPTVAATSAVEIGHWSDGGIPQLNPYYRYPEDYFPTGLTVDYSTAGWIQNTTYPDGRPYFAVLDGPDYILGSRVPTMWNIRYYSSELLTALVTNGALDPSEWPSNLATPQEAVEIWPTREPIASYPLIGNLLPDLRVMLVFAEHDHVQVAPDKPHVHQAYDGFRGAGLWIRLNPDLSYVRDANPQFGQFPEHPANMEPADWRGIASWGYPQVANANHMIPLAALAEMMDRVRENVWVPDLMHVIEPFNPSILGELTFIPSEVAGDTGICVYVIPPFTERYAAGAPIVIHLEGGTGGDGILFEPCPMARHGFVSIQFSFPGSGTGAAASGGLYDRRGPRSLAAVRDVVRFASGEINDHLDRSLAELIEPIVPLGDNIGLVGWSNGGNTTICAAGAHGDSMPGLAWIVNWESPVGDGMPTVEAGCIVPGTNPLVNPAYNESTGVFDYTTVSYDPTLQIDIMDGTAEYIGGLYFDINQNGVVDEGTDYVVRPFLHDESIYYSVGMTEYAYTHGVLPPAPPAHIASFAETQDFWYWRNGENWFDQVIALRPELMFLVEGSTVDHAQSAADHPHVLIQYNGFINSGTRLVRLNPDRSYVELVAGQAEPFAVDNDAFAPFSHTTIESGLEPSGSSAPNRDDCIAAAICELADRTWTNNTAYQLDWPLRTEEPPTPVAQRLRVRPIYPNPASGEAALRWWIRDRGEITITVRDIAGRRVARPFADKVCSGSHEHIWSTTDIPSGMYMVTVRSGNTRETLLLVVIR